MGERIRDGGLRSMKAWVHYKAGKPEEVLALSSNITVPGVLEEGEVLVKIRYASLNPAGSIMMQLLPFVFRTRPSIPEMDFSGSIANIARGLPEDRGLVVGDPVFGSIPVGQHVKLGRGALAGFVVVPVEAVCKKPQGLPFEQAAGLPIAGCTALALLDAANLKKGDAVLVNGASGGIGTLFLQMAKGAVGETGKVVAVCSGANVGMVRGLCADDVIDYKQYVPVQEHLTKIYGAQRFDVVVDCVGIQQLFLHCEGFLKPGQPYVTVGPSVPSYTVSNMLYSVGQMVKNFLLPPILGGVARPYLQVTMMANLKDMERLAKMAREENLKVPIDSCLDMEDALKGYEVLLSHRAKGKVVIAAST